MKEIRADRPIAPLCYIEGIQYNCLSASVHSKKGSPAQFSVRIPYDPNAFPSSVSVKETTETETHENGLPIIYDVEIQGIAKNTVVHLFEKDLDSGLERLVIEGRVTSVKKENSKSGLAIAISGVGPGYFNMELTAQMSDLGKALEIKDDWNSFGVASVSSIASKINGKGMREGILSVMDDAGNNTDVYHNLIWRLFHLFHRIQIIDNPKALGNFGNARMAKIIEKKIEAMKADAPVGSVIMMILQLVNYFQLDVLCPSFINAKAGSEEGHVVVDPDNKLADMDIEPEGGPSEHLKTNDTVYAPSIFLSPPPRCNVIFPSQYGKLVVQSDFSKNSTRGIVNITGRGQLTGSNQDKALIMPEEVADGITADGKYYISPEERILGITWSTFSQARPEAVEELKDSYVKGYMENMYSKARFVGHQVSLAEAKYNSKPIVGLPTLILSSDGRHWIAELEELTLSYRRNRGSTNYVFGLCRPYDEVVPSAPATYWFEHDMFSQDNIGSYIYPRIIGELNEVGIGGVVPEDQTADMSIMAHLFQGTPAEYEVEAMTYGEARAQGIEVPPDFPDDYPFSVGTSTTMTEEEIEAAYEDPGAPKKAIDNLFGLWRKSESKIWFGKYYGARKGITREQWFTDFLKCQHSDDWFIVGNGYTLATNSVTIPDTEDTESEEMTNAEARLAGMNVPDDAEDDDPYGVGALADTTEEEFGEKLSLDQEFTGCFVKERQNAILPLAMNSIGAMHVPAQVEQLLSDQLEESIAEEIEGYTQDE